MTSGELERWLNKQGCTILPGKGGHKLVRLGGQEDCSPYHGKNRQVATGTMVAVKKALDLLDRD